MFPEVRNGANAQDFHDRQRLRENVEKEREQRNTELHKGGGGEPKSSMTQRLKGSLFKR